MQILATFLSKNLSKNLQISNNFCIFVVDIPSPPKSLSSLSSPSAPIPINTHLNKR